MNLADILLMKNGNTVKPDADLFDILLPKKLSGGSGVITTITGNPLSFITRKAQTAIDTKLIMFPIQEGSGDPSPTNVRPISGRQSVSLDGCGKNLVNIETQTNITRQTYVFRNRSYLSGTYTVSANLSNAGNGKVFMRISDSRGNYYDSEKVESTEQRVSINFEVDETLFYTLMVAGTESGYNATISNIQLELGLSVTPYSPYTPNPAMPVTVQFPALGKNIWHTNFIYEDNITKKADGEYTAKIIVTTSYLLGGSSETNRVNFEIPKGTYTLSLYSETFQGMYAELSDGTEWQNGQTKIFEETTYIYTIRCHSQPLDIGTYYWKMQIEKGSSVTTYEPYTNTLYGGTLDVEKGELTVDRVMMDLGTLSWTKSATNKFSSNVIQDAKLFSNTQKTTATSSEYVAVAGGNIGNVDFAFCFGLNENKVIMINDSTKYNLTAQEFTAEVSGVQLVYELATPTTIQLTPSAQVQLLKGNNTIWTDGDEIELTYKA